jgi:uncharacterized protein YbjT (DUF2867 family)
MKTVFIAGATGYLGRFLCAEYRARGWHVTALVRDRGRAGGLEADRLVEAEATRPETLAGVMDGADLVVSALGITRQADGLTYRDVDYRRNLNLLREAERAGVGRFAYVHVLNADAMRDVPLVAAKADFVDALHTSALPSTVIAPSGYFSDMGEFLSMARSGRVWLFAPGTAPDQSDPRGGPCRCDGRRDRGRDRLAGCRRARDLHASRACPSGGRLGRATRAHHAAARLAARWLWRYCRA